MSALTSCRNDGACQCADDDADCDPAEQLCSAHTIEGDGSLYGQYCTERASCFTSIEDAGVTLYVSCPSESSLVSCSDDGDCEGEGESCVPHTYEGRDGSRALQDSYCAAEADCFTELEDDGRTLYVDCPLVSELTPCSVADGCAAATEVCSPYTYSDDSGAESTDGYYCADESECYQDIVDAGKDLYVNCPA